jgi:hypothetical protein
LELLEHRLNQLQIVRFWTCFLIGHPRLRFLVTNATQLVLFSFGLVKWNLSTVLLISVRTLSRLDMIPIPPTTTAIRSNASALLAACYVEKREALVCVAWCNSANPANSYGQTLATFSPKRSRGRLISPARLDKAASSRSRL